MADSVVKLRIDSKEYDANIKRAGQALTDYFNRVREGGGSLKYLDDGVMEAVQAMGQLGTKADSTKGGLREMTQAITDLTAQYRQFTDEEKNSPLGRELAKSINEMTERAGMMRDAMADVSASITNAASDTRRFDQAAQGIGLMTSGFQTLQGAAKLLGIQFGDNVEVIAKLQAAMAVTNGLTQAQNALQKQSALMQGVMAVQAKAAAVAVELEGSATKAATVAQAAFNAVAKANPYVLLASAVVAVGAALFAFSGHAKQATDDIKDNTQAMDSASRMADIWKNTMGNTFSSLMTKYDELKRQWMALRTEHEKTEWIKANQSALKGLEGSVHDVKSAEDFFNRNTDAVVQSFVRRAQAAARVAQLTELYRKQIELLDKKSQTSAEISGDAQRSGRSAKAGEEITDATFRNSRYGSVNSAGKWVFSEKGAQLYSGTNTSTSSSVMKIDVELEANQKEIDKVKGQITSEFSDVTIGGGGRSATGGGGRSGGGSGGGSTPTTERELTIQQQISELEKEAYTASTERRIEIGQTIQALDKELEKQKEIRDQIHGIVKESPTETGISGMSSNAIGSYRNMVSSVMGNMEIGGNDYTAAMENLIDVNTLSNVLQEAMEDGVDLAATGINVGDLWDNILGGENIPDDVWQELQDKINEQLADMGIDPINIDFGTGNVEKQAKKMKDDWKDAASAIEQVGSAMASIEDPAAKVVGTVAQAIATIALGYAKATLQATEQGGPWAWIAFAATGLATMISTISAIHSATGYAEGGIIKGSTYSGDNIMANGGDIALNAGELVLNRAQQGNLAAQLSDQDNTAVTMQPYVDGEKIFLGMNNHAKRSGKGEIVTTSTLRRLGLM